MFPFSFLIFSSSSRSVTLSSLMRLSRVFSTLFLGLSAVQTYSYAVRATLPRFGVRRRVDLRHSIRCGVTSDLIEATTCQVLRLVLLNGREAHVSCSVQSNAFELLQGRLRGASVAGRGWASRLGFTARTIDVDVGSVNLDTRNLFQRRLLRFQHPLPSGTAVVVFNAQDFGNFLAHPLICQTSLAGRSFVFDRDGVVIDPNRRTVAFGGRWCSQQLRFALGQESACASLVARVGDGVVEDERGAVDAKAAATIATEMVDYFHNLEVDLDGPCLKFSSLSFEGGGVDDGRVKLNLGIVVRKFPSIGAVTSF